jgi:hypothetical protein
MRRDRMGCNAMDKGVSFDVSLFSAMVVMILLIGELCDDL